MDKLNVISSIFFFLADVFAVTSLGLPYWIVSDSSSGVEDTHLGLIEVCLTIYGRPKACYFTSAARPEWALTFFFISIGVLCITTTVILLVAAHWYEQLAKHARWIGFTGMVCFCIAAVIFPVGFRMDEIGGRPYQLPASFRVGLSYIFFILALWITVISELLAGKVCLPHF